MAGVAENLALGVDVAEGHRLELERTEPPCEGVLLVDGQELAREDQQGVFEPRLVQRLERGFADGAQLDAGDYCAESGVQRVRCRTGRWPWFGIPFSAR